jgi:DNA-binding MarR family transcriptional regulator
LRLLRLNRDDEVAVALAVGRPMTEISRVAKQQQRRLTKPQQTELIERYRSGDLMTELAKKFEIDRRTVSAILKRHKVPTRPQGLSVEQIQDAVLMYAQGNSLTVIGSKLGVDRRTVDKRLRKQSVQMRDTRGRAYLNLHKD